MKLKFVGAACIAGLIFLPAVSSPSLAGTAAVDLSLQGRLTNALGDPLNGNVDVVVRLYDAVTAGTLRYEERFAAVDSKALPVTNGQYSVALGSGAGTVLSANTLETALRNYSALWMTFVIAADAEMAPRVAVRAAPYAVNARSLEGSRYPKATANPAAAVSVQGDLFYDTDDNVAKVYDGASWLPFDVNLWGRSGTVLSPRTADDTVQAGNGTAGAPAYAFATDANTGIYGDGADGLYLSTAGAERVRINASGQVGIGGITPGFALDVAGRMRLRQTPAGTAGSWYYQTTPAADRAFIGMQNDDNIGIFGSGAAGWGLLMNVNTRVTSMTYLSALPQDGTNEGGEIQLQGAGAFGALQLDNYQGNARIHTLAANKYFQVVGDGATLLLPTKSTAGDPATAVDGQIYYNTSTAKFRGRQNGQWINFFTSTGNGPSQPRIVGPIVGANSGSVPPADWTDLINISGQAGWVQYIFCNAYRGASLWGTGSVRITVDGGAPQTYAVANGVLRAVHDIDGSNSINTGDIQLYEFPLTLRFASSVRIEMQRSAAAGKGLVDGTVVYALD